MEASGKDFKMASSASNQNGEDLEIESQFVLRMPSIRDKVTGEIKPHPATLALREALSKLTPASTEEVLKDRLFIDINTDTRRGRLKFDKDTFEARLVDLPCVVESLKTYDKKSFYKIADICQMLVCLPPGDKWPQSSSSEDEVDAEAAAAKKKKKTKEALLKKYKWSHGLAPPLKNVRHKRFRKMPKKQIENQAEVQRLVKKLFRADRDAVKVEYEELHDYVDNENDANGNEEEEEEDEDDECTKTNIYDEDDDEDEEDEYSSQFEDTSLSKSAASGRRRGGRGKKLNETSNSQSQMRTSAKSKKSAMSGVDHSSNPTNDESMTNLKENTSSDNLRPNEETTMTTMMKSPAELANEDTNQSNLSDGKSAGGVVKQIFGDISSSSDEEDEDETKDQTAAEDLNFSSSNFNLDLKYVHFSGSSVTKSKKGSSAEQRKPTPASPPDKEEDDSNSMMFGMEGGESMLLGGQHQEKAEDEEEESDEEETTMPLEFGASSFSKIKFSMETVEAEAEVETETVSKKEADLRAHQSTIDEILNLSLSSASDTEEVAATATADLAADFDPSSSNNRNLDELHEKLSVLTSEMEKISEDRKKRELEILSIKNPALKAVLMSKTNNLIEEESKKVAEIEAIQEQIQQLKNS